MNAIQLLAALAKEVAEHPERALLPVLVGTDNGLARIDFLGTEEVDSDEPIEDDADLDSVQEAKQVQVISIVTL